MECRKKVGFQAFTPARNAQNKEKRVDTGFDKEVLKDLYKGAIEDDDEIILVVGDSDHHPVAEAIIEEGKQYTELDRLCTGREWRYISFFILFVFPHSDKRFSFHC